MGEINFAHAAPAKLTLDFVRADLCKRASEIHGAPFAGLPRRFPRDGSGLTKPGNVLIGFDMLVVDNLLGGTPAVK
jgi:hypothetical protein